ncbi:LCP family protein [uncultured Oscillibacter sp.]|uniref:LCP family protein n=1 Tax=uncultured Oscillibacter sp. TaxID=876091 RepID=UPI00216BE0E1|nr:LCP family protein [uncultured Oscillibacter sp.]MCI9461046.1 LCP family protein [Oscillibacter sp.]
MSKIGKRLAPSEKPKSPRKGKLSRQQIILIVVIVVLAIALAAVLAMRSLFVRPEIPKRNPPQQTTDADGDGKPDEPEGIDYGDGIRPRGGDGERKSADYWTVLIIGRDTGGGGLTDTLLLASYDVTNQKATVMSIPRDTMVNIPYDIKRINAVYNYYGGEERGIQHLYKEIAQLVGFEPDFQVVVEWDAVGEIVDAIGGVYFDVPQDMNYDDPYQDLHIHQAAGYRLLSGDDAMQVLRYRHDNRKNGVMKGYPDGDLGRIKTQQAFLKAMVDQLLKPKNMTKVGPLIEAFNKNVETDMSFQNILWFGQQAVMGGLNTENVNFVTMPNRAKYAYSRSVGNMQSYVVPNARELLDLVNNELSPFTEIFTLSDLDIMSVNADGSLSSSTGYVEDKKAALPPPKEEPEEEEPVVDENGNPIDPETGLPIDPETGEPVTAVDPETGEPLVTAPPDTAVGTGESGGGSTNSGGESTNPGGSSQPGGTPSSPPDTGTTQPPAVGTPSTPETPETPPAPTEPAPEVPADPQLPADPGFTLIGPDPAA